MLSCVLGTIVSKYGFLDKSQTIISKYRLLNRSQTGCLLLGESPVGVQYCDVLLKGWGGSLAKDSSPSPYKAGPVPLSEPSRAVWFFALESSHLPWNLWRLLAWRPSLHCAAFELQRKCCSERLNGWWLRRNWLLDFKTKTREVQCTLDLLNPNFRY